MFGPDEKEEREFRKNNPYVKEQKAKEAEAEKQLFDKFRILADCPCTFFGLNMADEIEKTYHEALERGKKEGFVPIIVFVSDILYDEIMKEFNIVTGEEISINYINSKRKELIDIASDSEGKKWLDNTLQKNGTNTVVRTDTTNFWASRQTKATNCTTCASTTTTVLMLQFWQRFQ